MKTHARCLTAFGWLGTLLCCIHCTGGKPALPRGNQGIATHLMQGSVSTATENSFGTHRESLEPDAGMVRKNPTTTNLPGLAGDCYSLEDGRGRWLVRSGRVFGFASTGSAQASAFFLQAADLGTYLLYDREQGYLSSNGNRLARETALLSDILTLDDSYVSGAEWDFLDGSGGTVLLRQRRSGHYLGGEGLVGEASAATALKLVPALDCATHPELSLDAEGEVQRTHFEDGTLYGIVDTHSHLLTNFGFGGGGIFHGAPFHRLGVEHALPDCTPFHGSSGRRDVFGYGFDGLSGALDPSALLSLLTENQLGENNHRTTGYPFFEDWPNAPTSSTHQTQYWVWLQRAWLSGLRLVIQHATSNSAICEFTVGQGLQQVRYACDDMTAVDRELEEARAMERYIDAQSGGAGKGFFRLVETAAEARNVIAQGKLAVVLGIETSNLFNCALAPRPGGPVCDEAYVRAQLQEYHSRGVRVLFPVHKYDNGFSAGDGNRDFIELGNFINSGHYSNFVNTGCPDIPSVFDKGDVVFGGLNRPRPQYDADPPVDMSGFRDNPVGSLVAHVDKLLGPKLRGDFCMQAGLTELGESLLRQMMLRGMLIEIDHLPRRSYARAFELLEQYDYPAIGSHGNNNNGKLYELGGVSAMALRECRNPNKPGAMLQPMQGRLQAIEAAGGYPSEGFGFDLNGFAGARKPRFGERSPCKEAQVDPVTYPFHSLAHDVTFTQPRVGQRTIDYNTEGFVHIGLLPEMIDEARRDAADERDLEPIFRSAEGYLRMWEKAEARSRALNGGS